jgi:putative metal binding uncharacterized protein/uncharacterized protein DUF2604
MASQNNNENERREELNVEITAEKRELADLEHLEGRVRDRIAEHEAELERLRREDCYHLEVVVNGTAVAIHADPDKPLEIVVIAALKKTENEGQPPERWTLTNEQSVELDKNRSPESYKLPSGAKIFLSLDAGEFGEGAVAQFVDPAVSSAKFDEQIAEYRRDEATYRARGWLLLAAEFPTVVFAMAAPHLVPTPLVTGVAFDYTNYDAEPPSVRLVNPFTWQPYQPTQLPILLVRPKLPPGFVPQPGQPVPMEQLVQCHEGGVPFICVAGVREYHAHPAHSADPWMAHRANGEGKFVRLLDIIDRIGIKPIGFNLSLVSQFTLELAPAA